MDERKKWRKVQKRLRIDKDDVNAPGERGKITVSVVGCSRPGLAVSCLLADAGFKVFSVDSDQSVVGHINKGVSPFADLEVESLLRKNVREGRLLATSEVKETVPDSQMVWLFARPRIDQRRRPDYSNTEKTCKDVGLNLRSGTLAIVGSDLAPRVTETLIKETLETASGLKAGTDFGLAYCSFQAAPGKGLQDVTSHPNVFGAIGKESLELTEAVLNTITRGEITAVSNTRTAEAVRLFENVCRDVNVALANELARFCEKAGIDFMEVRKAVNLRPHCHLFVPKVIDEQVSGRSCLLIEEAEVLKTRLRMASLGRKINDAFFNQVFYLVKDALRSCGRTVRRARILVLGASCQPNVKELYGSLVKDLVEVLVNKGMHVKVYDPLFSFKELTQSGYPAERTVTRAVKGMDCLLIAVGHDRFKRLDLGRIRILMRKPSAIVDIGYVLDPSKVEEKGFVYRGLGRGVWTR